MAESLDHIPLNTLGALGVDRRNAVSDVRHLACLDMLNLDVHPGDAPEGTRVAPRPATRRFGQQAHQLSAVPTGSGSFSGTYTYRWVWTDGSGRTHHSWKGTVIASNDDHVLVSGWPTSAGTVDIFRTTDGGSTLKEVVTGLDVTANSDYQDSTADGALGADYGGLETHVDPLGNDDFSQTALCDLLTLYTSDDEDERVLALLVRTDGLGGSGTFYYGYPDRSEPENEELRATPVETGLGEQPVSAAVLNGIIWLARGGSALKYRDLNAASLGLSDATQPAQPTLVKQGTPQVAGNLDAATSHIYVAQAEDERTGIRSLPSDPLEFTGPYSSKKNQLNVSGSGSNVDYHIYRTSDGGSLFQFLKTESGSGDFDDEAADSTLSQQTVPFEVGPPDGCKFVFEHKGVLFTLRKTNDPESTSLVRWSTALYPVNFPADPDFAPDYEYEIGKSDGDELVGGFSWGEVAAIFKRRKAYLIAGDPPTGFRWTPIEGSEDLGCIAHRTIQETPAGLFYLSAAGVCVMAQPGSPPIVISDGIREVFAETQREFLDAQDSELTREAPSLEIVEATAGTFQVQVQLDTDPAFGSIDFDYVTTDTAERPYFLANNGPFPAAGVVVTAGRRVRISVIPPDPGSGGPAAATTYYARYAIDTGSGFGAWIDAGTFERPSDDPHPDAINVAKAHWAFGLSYPARNEYWLFVPTGDRTWCDTAWICNYGPMLSGGRAVWRKVAIAASAGALLTNLVVEGQPAADYLLIASPDGLLFLYPWTHDGNDQDIRVTLTDQTFAGSVSSGAITGTGTSWTTTRYGLAGTVVTVRDADGAIYTGLISANTGTTLTVTWLHGRTPPDGSIEGFISGMATLLRGGWLRLSRTAGHTAILRQVVLHSGPGRGQVDAIVRASKEPERNYRRARSKRLEDLPVGRGFTQVRRGVGLRGHAHQLELNDIAAGQVWDLHQVELAIEETGSRI